jgi:FKBP-type peptidyl-prolyl cis-trans isomerase 2
MTHVKENDFIEIEYTGRTKDDKSVFDTTEKSVAEKEGLMDQKSVFEPSIVCIGQGHLLPGLDKRLVGKEAGKTYSIEVPMDEAFGKRDAKMIQMIPLNRFHRQRINPVPGLQLNIDGAYGTVKTVSGGRCIVDFNHFLAGKDLVYDIRINKVVTDDKGKLDALMKMYMHAAESKIEINGDAVNITYKSAHHGHAHPKEPLVEIAKKVLPHIKTINLTEEKPAKAH